MVAVINRQGVYISQKTDVLYAPGYCRTQLE